MKQILATIATICLAACSQNEQNINKIHCTIESIFRDSLTLLVDGKQLTLAHTHTPDCAHGCYLEGDSVVVEYHGSEVDDVAVVSHRRPCMNNASVLLVGTWAAPNYNITLTANNLATIEDNGEVRESQWILLKNEVLMCFVSDAAETRRYNLIRVDSDSLLVGIDAETVLKLKRLR